MSRFAQRVSPVLVVALTAVWLLLNQSLAPGQVLLGFALSVVLAALLLATGMGSLWSAAIVRRLGGQPRFVAYALGALILADHLLALPLLPRLLGLPFPLRVLIAALVVGPVGGLLGVFVPTALERLKPEAPAFVPWAWGINGMFSVLAPLLSVAVSMTWGISALLLAAVPVYLLVGWVYPPPAFSPAAPPPSAGGPASRG